MKDRFPVKLIFNGKNATGIFTIASKLLFFKYTKKARHSTKRPASGEVTISKCSVTWRTVKVERS